MRSKKVISLSAGLLALALVVATPTAAQAFNEIINSTTTNTSWINYATNRTTTQVNVSYTTGNMLQQTMYASAFNLRLNNTSNAPISAAQTWTTNLTTKPVISGLAVGTTFRLGVCCYSTITGDSAWGGTLTY